MLNNVRGHLVVVMAPMGSGKGTVIEHALELHPSMYRTISCTSRAMRPKEVDGDHYHFISPEQFEARIKSGDFLEWATFAGNKYGTPKSEVLPRLDNCGVVIVEIELQGVEQLLELIPRENMTIVYIEAGGWEVLRARAAARAPMSDTELEARYQRFLIEQQSKPMADVIINNDADIETAHAEFAQVIEEAYKKCKV
ncbi:MAG: guanylate kinase [Candidatus Parcubacteria bacterium]|jgi:guanylate kinase